MNDIDYSDYSGPDYACCTDCDSAIVDDQIEYVDDMPFCEGCAEEAREDAEQE